MRISPIAIACIAFFASPAWSDETKTAAVMAAPVSGVAMAADASPTAAAMAVSPAAVAAAEPEIEDDAQAVSPSAALDLTKAETRLLAKISESIAVDQDKILFNLEENAPADKPGIGVNEVDATSLFLELARRAVADEKEARQALSLAIVRGDKRAQDAKTQAYEERLADSLIKRINNGDQGAKDELMKQALAGNMKARLFLGLDKPTAVSIPESMSGTAKAADAPASVSPAAKPTEEHGPSMKGTGY